VLNRSIDKRPALVVQPSGVADVRSAVTFARDRDLLLAVKCGGHSFGGKSTCDGGMQIDLARLRGLADLGTLAMNEKVALRRIVFRLYALLKIHMAEELLYAELLAVKRTLGSEHEAALIRNLRDR